MTPAAHPIEVYLETAPQRTLAAAIDWPGWCRGGRDEAAALAALAAYGARYAHVVHNTSLAFAAPADPSVFVVVERLAGNASTDYGVPALVLARDTEPLAAAELERLQQVLTACWGAFDRVVQAASGRELTRGPRGGGRELPKIVQHVLEAEGGYLSKLGGKLPPEAVDAAAAGQGEPGSELGSKLLGERLAARLAEPLVAHRQAIFSTLHASARGEILSLGPRGGQRWPARYFVRRLAWHVLDHAWEIEDRLR